MECLDGSAEHRLTFLGADPLRAPLDPLSRVAAHGLRRLAPGRGTRRATPSPPHSPGRPAPVGRTRAAPAGGGLGDRVSVESQAAARRAARLLRWYPRDWRSRYGDEFA